MSGRQAKPTVTAKAQPELRGIVEGVRDSAFEVGGKTDKDAWQKAKIEWLKDNASATLRNLGDGCISLTLRAETFSSNGVHGVSQFEVELRDKSTSVATEEWTADWTEPSPGSSSGHRMGDSVIPQLDTELSRFIEPIMAGNVLVTLS